jgi:hypothetical protein
MAGHFNSTLGTLGSVHRLVLQVLALLSTLIAIVQGIKFLGELIGAW